MDPPRDTDPTILALMSPRFRAIAVELHALPVTLREARFLAWVETQPDRDEIRAAVEAADLSRPPPPWTDTPEAN